MSRLRIAFSVGQGGPEKVFVAASKRDLGDVLNAIEAELLRMAKGDVCRSMTMGVHVEGPNCDHDAGTG